MWNYKNSDKISILLVLSSFSQASTINRTQSSTERIVTDWDMIDSPQGVPLDFTYNETKSGPESFPSAPGCPKSTDGNPWVHFGNPPRCYLVGYSGPCGFDRSLVLDQSFPLGICACYCFTSYTKGYGLDIDDTIETSPNGQFKFCGSDQVYDSDEKICYNLNERGRCAPGQWLVRGNNSDSLICVTECPLVDGDRQVYNLETGKCEKFNRNHQAPTLSKISPNECKDTEYYSNADSSCRPNPKPFEGR